MPLPQNHLESHCLSDHPSHQQLALSQVEEVCQPIKSNVKISQIFPQLCESDIGTLEEKIKLRRSFVPSNKTTGFGMYQLMLWGKFNLFSLLIRDQFILLNVGI
ncbi:hypothetical protein VP01_1826g5 [Puccinia sorghi]|uniref:Uncharacterized protein n=1 Tax=Puccinia sorghi TaxID=27349 RepID=A0A0L6VE16_9BASI|nr:hypothetical protein VP01_1826g5 [Puccinia sorghi]